MDEVCLVSAIAAATLYSPPNYRHPVVSSGRIIVPPGLGIINALPSVTSLPATIFEPFATGSDGINSALAANEPFIGGMFVRRRRRSPEPCSQEPHSTRMLLIVAIDSLETVYTYY